HTQARDEASSTGPNHILIAHAVGHAETRLDVAPLDVRVMVWNAAEQAAEIELTRVRLGTRPFAEAGNALPGMTMPLYRSFVDPVPVTRPFLSIVPRMRPVVRSIVTALFGS